MDILRFRDQSDLTGRSPDLRIDLTRFNSRPALADQATIGRSAARPNASGLPKPRATTRGVAGSSSGARRWPRRLPVLVRCGGISSSPLRRNTGQMTGLTYKGINAILSTLALGGGARGYRVTTVIDEDDCWLATWANDDTYAIVQASQYDKERDRTLVEVCAGGAYGAQPDGGLFQSLATSAGAYDFGGPWARVMSDGTTSYGWRSRLPSELSQRRTKATRSASSSKWLMCSAPQRQASLPS